MNRITTNFAPSVPITVDIKCGRRANDRLPTTPIRYFRPRAKDEADFDIATPPRDTVIPPGKAFLGFIETSLTVNDVLLGRGQNTSRRAGNRLFRSLVADFRPIYLTSKRIEKRKTARTIVLIVRQRGGRFLRRVGEDGNDNVHGEFLYEAGDERAERKTAQALREGLAVRAKMGVLKGRVSHQGKVDGVNGMAAEHQEPPDKGAVLAWGWGEDMAMTKKSTNPQSTQALRKGFSLRATTDVLKGHVSHQGKASGSDRMAAECQAPPDEGAVIALRWGEETAKTITGTNTQTTRYDRDDRKEYYQTEKFCDGWSSSSTGRRDVTPPVTLPPGFESSLSQQHWNTAVSPMVHHSKTPVNNAPCRNAVSPQTSFRSGQELVFVVCPSVLPCHSSYSGPMQQRSNLNNSCNGPMHCDGGPPPSHGHDSKPPQVHPKSPPTVSGGTLLSSSTTDHLGHSGRAHQGCTRMHSVDNWNSCDDGDRCPTSLASNVDLADFFATPCTDAMSSFDDGAADLPWQETSSLCEW